MICEGIVTADYSKVKEGSYSCLICSVPHLNDQSDVRDFSTHVMSGDASERDLRSADSHQLNLVIECETPKRQMNEMVGLEAQNMIFCTCGSVS